MVIPDHGQDRETNGEGEKTTHRFDQLIEVFRNLQGNNQQSEREPEDGVAERFQPGHLAAAHAETMHDFRAASHPRFAQHKSSIPMWELA